MGHAEHDTASNPLTTHRMELEALFDAHYAALHRYLARLIGDRDVADDAAQEAFARAIDRPPQGGVSRAWLYRVATNFVLESMRTAGRRRRLLGASRGYDLMADPPPDPQRRVESRDEQARVAAALAGLATKERVAVLMRTEGFAQREIAEAIGTTTGSVGTLLARAFAKLARDLGEEGHDER